MDAPHRTDTLLQQFSPRVTLEVRRSSSSPLPNRVSNVVTRTIAAEESRGHAAGLLEGLKLIRRFCTAMDLKQIMIDRAEEIFKDAAEAKAQTGGFRGKRFELAVAACVVAACRVAGFPRSETEVCEACGVKDVPGVVKMYGDIVDLVIRKWYASILQDVVRPKAYIGRFIQHVSGVDDETVRAVRRRVDIIADIVEDKCVLENKGADIVCSAMIVLAMQESKISFDAGEFATRCKIPARSIELVVAQLHKTLK